MKPTKYPVDVIPTTSWFYNAWVEEENLKQKYMVGFIVSTIVNLILFGVLVT
jgi:hypothetical protein